MSHATHRAPARPSRVRRSAIAFLSLSTLVAPALVGLAGPAQAASVISAAFSGGYKAADGTVYAKSGTALTLTVNTDGNTQCVDVIDGNGNTIATKSGS